MLNLLLMVEWWGRRVGEKRVKMVDNAEYVEAENVEAENVEDVRNRSGIGPTTKKMK